MQTSVNELLDWILTEGTAFDSISLFTMRYCQHLNAVGIPVDRVFIGTLVMHPQAAGWATSYTMGDDSAHEALPTTSLKHGSVHSGIHAIHFDDR